MTDPLTTAISAATENARNGHGPFGAVIVLPDGRTVTAQNQVAQTNDPTAHAEVQAIRAASKVWGSPHLVGAVLYSSCKPCPMCWTAAQWAHLDRVEYAATSAQASAVGFDDAQFWAAVTGRKDPATPVHHVAHDQATEPFTTWWANPDRVWY